MAKSVLLEVITPSKLFYKGKVEMVIVKTFKGEEGFMAGHTWSCKLLDVGILWIKEAGSSTFKAAAAAQGYIDVRDNIVIYLDAAEWVEDIDSERAMNQKAIVEEWLSGHESDNAGEDEIMKAKIALAKQNTRIKLAQSGGIRK